MLALQELGAFSWIYKNFLKYRSFIPFRPERGRVKDLAIQWWRQKWDAVKWEKLVKWDKNPQKTFLAYAGEVGQNGEAGQVIPKKLIESHSP